MMDLMMPLTVVNAGEFDAVGIRTAGDVLDQAGRMLDKACSHDICGPSLFLASDGQYYTVVVEAELVLMDSDWVEERLDEIGHLKS